MLYIQKKYFIAAKFFSTSTLYYLTLYDVASPSVGSGDWRVGQRQEGAGEKRPLISHYYRVRGAGGFRAESASSLSAPPPSPHPVPHPALTSLARKSHMLCGLVRRVWIPLKVVSTPTIETWWSR